MHGVQALCIASLLFMKYKVSLIHTHHSHSPNQFHKVISLVHHSISQFMCSLCLTVWLFVCLFVCNQLILLLLSVFIFTVFIHLFLLLPVPFVNWLIHTVLAKFYSQITHTYTLQYKWSPKHTSFDRYFSYNPISICRIQNGLSDRFVIPKTFIGTSSYILNQ